MLYVFQVSRPQVRVKAWHRFCQTFQQCDFEQEFIEILGQNCQKVGLCYYWLRIWTQCIEGCSPTCTFSNSVKIHNIIKYTLILTRAVSIGVAASGGLYPHLQKKLSILQLLKSSSKYYRVSITHNLFAKLCLIFTKFALFLH